VTGPSQPEDHRTIRHGERILYDNEWVRLTLVDIEPPDGRRFEHHVIHMKPVAIAVLMNENSEILMLRRHRFATDEWGHELLGGLVEAGESPAETAAREALEESGWKPNGPPEHLIRFQPLPGMVDAPVDAFLWRDFQQIDHPTDLEEAGEMRWVPLADVPQMIADRDVLGAGTIIALLQLVALAHGVDFKPSSS
jgi:8-oxo-dGTP pyrophosphatase MutT (NUDIX family)